MDSWKTEGASATIAKGQVNMDNIHRIKQQSEKKDIQKIKQQCYCQKVIFQRTWTIALLFCFMDYKDNKLYIRV
jgi:hypothetical protein